MANKRTYRVKKGYGPHQIIIAGEGTSKAVRAKIYPGETFNDFPDSRNVQGWEFKLEVISGGVLVDHEIVRQEVEVEETKDAAALRKISRGSNRFDVVNEDTGEKLNNRLLSSKEADELINMGAPEKPTVEVGGKDEEEKEEEEQEEKIASGAESKKRRQKIE